MHGQTPDSPLLAGGSPLKNVAKKSGAVSLGQAVGRGFSWITLSVIAGKALGAVTQLLLGRWISEEQFGDFAVVAAISAMVKIFQDGGVPQVLIQRGDAEFDRQVGPAFWLSTTFGLVAGLVLALAAPVLAWIYDAPVLIGLLLVVAVTLPLGAASTVLRAKLRVELRFQTVAIIAIGWYLIRNSGTIAMAALGMGLMSLVVPLVIVALYEWAADYYATRMKPWKEAAEVHLWPGLLGKSVWVVSMGASRGLARTGDYLVLPLMLSKAVVGPYFFGYQLTTQIVELLATNLQHVLFPALSRITHEPERQSRAILLTIRMLVFVAAPVSLGLAVTIGPLVAILDSTIWRDKWSVAIPLMQIFAVAAPLRMFSDVVTASLSARGQFRESATLMLAEGLWLMMSAGLGVAIFGANITGIALVVAIAQAVFSMSSSVVILRRFEIGAGAFFGAFAGTWLTSAAAAAVAAGAIYLLPGDARHVVRLATGAAVFTAAFIAMARIFLRANVDELIRVSPKRVAKVVQRVLVLPDASS